MGILHLLEEQMEVIIAISRIRPKNDVTTKDDKTTDKDCSNKCFSPISHFLAVLADLVKSALVGAPLVPTFLIFSPEPSAIRFFFAWILAYRPGLVAMINP
jgi:hypothetical protein